MKNDLIKIQSAFFAVRHKYLGSKQLPIWNCNFSFAPSVEVCNLERIPKSFFFQFSKLMIYKCKSLPLPGKIDQTVFLSFFGEMRINGAVCLHHGAFNSGTQNQLFHCVKVTVKKTASSIQLFHLNLRLNVVLRMALIFRRGKGKRHYFVL